MIAQEWRDIPGYEGYYQVSNFGNVKRVKVHKATKVGRILVGYVDKDGYHRVQLSKSDGGKSYGVHRLVCLAFNGEPFGENQLVCHKDGNPSNNASENLYWGTFTDNQMDMLSHKRGSAFKTHCKNGHEFTPENTYLYIGKHRRCRTCHRADSLRSWNYRKG